MIRLFVIAFLALCCLIMVQATVNFPVWGDPNSPASVTVSPEYITQTYERTHTPNLVTAVLGDYRGFDTLMETVVVFAAGLACLFILRFSQPTTVSTYREYWFRHVPTGVVLHTTDRDKVSTRSGAFEQIDSDWTPHDMVVDTVCRLLVPFIQLYGLYVLVHGHYSPGGGFQGGVIFASSYILVAVSYDLRTMVAQMDERRVGLMSVAGVLIFFGIGFISLAHGSAFLDYAELTKYLGTPEADSRYMGVFFVETGVGLTVTAAMVQIFKLLSSSGTISEGL